jgi:hypothetical protein
MELMKGEVEAVKQVILEIEKADVRALDDLQLALIGGGIGDVVWG